MAINFERGGNPKKTLDIGVEKLVEDWLDLYGIQYNKEEFRYLKRKDSILAIEVPVDNALMVKKYKDTEHEKEEKYVPSFVKDGRSSLHFNSEIHVFSCLPLS